LEEKINETDEDQHKGVIWSELDILNWAFSDF